MDSFPQAQECILGISIIYKVAFKYFDTCIGPTLLVGIRVFSLSRFQYLEFDKLQMKMLRCIVDWRRIEKEELRITMIRTTTSRTSIAFISVSISVSAFVFVPTFVFIIEPAAVSVYLLVSISVAVSVVVYASQYVYASVSVEQYI